MTIISENDEVVFHAGFPNAAEDGKFGSLSLDDLAVQRRASTFFWRLASDVSERQWSAGDVLVVDRALDPKEGRVVVASTGSEFVLARVRDGNLHRLDSGGFDTEPVVWGVVTYCLQKV